MSAAALRKRLDWSRPLPRPLTIPQVMTLKTLADVRELIERHLPEHCLTKTTWHYVSAQLEEAAHDGNTAHVAMSLRMVLAMEGVPCRPR